MTDMVADSRQYGQRWEAENYDDNSRRESPTTAIPSAHGNAGAYNETIMEK
jgi:hypothetical protein